MINENTKLNIILGIIIAILVIFNLLIFYNIRNFDSSKNLFDISEIEGVEWKNTSTNSDLLIEDGKINLTINNDTIYYQDIVSLNKETGEFTVNNDGNIENGILYLRSVGSNNIVVWYEEAEYRLDKVVEYK